MYFNNLPPFGEESLVVRYSFAGVSDTNNRRAARSSQKSSTGTAYNSDRHDKAKGHVECYEGWYCQNRS